MYISSELAWTKFAPHEINGAHLLSLHPVVTSSLYAKRKRSDYSTGILGTCPIAQGHYRCSSSYFNAVDSRISRLKWYLRKITVIMRFKIIQARLPFSVPIESPYAVSNQ